MKKKVIAVLLVFAVAAGAVLFLPVWPVVGAEDDVVIYDVELYYKGQRQENLDAYLKLKDMELMLRLYDTSLVPTEAWGQRVSEYYFVIYGSKDGRGFTITADSGNACWFYTDGGRGYRLKNGDVLQGMIYSCARDEYRDYLQELLSLAS